MSLIQINMVCTNRCSKVKGVSRNLGGIDRSVTKANVIVIERNVIVMGIRVEEITVAEVFQVKGGRSHVSKKKVSFE